MTNPTTEADDRQLDAKYRPATLDDVIGHDSAVAQLRGIVASGKYPNVLAFFGPTSVGKTTLARAVATTALGAPCLKSPNYTEINASDNRSIDDMRALIAESKLRPINAPRRFIMIDEAQGILATPASAAALLKPMEEPGGRTTWIIGSMDPDKFATTANGRAMLTRATRFVLKPHTPDDKMAMLLRIRKGEDMRYVSRELAESIVERSQGMRDLALMMQQLAAYYAGLDAKSRPKQLSQDDLTEAMSFGSDDDDARAVRLLVSIYAGSNGAVIRELLNASDYFALISKMMNLNWFAMADTAMKGTRHPKVWASKAGISLRDQLRERNVTPAQMACVNAGLVKMRIQATTYSLPEHIAIAAAAHQIIGDLNVNRG